MIYENLYTEFKKAVPESEGFCDSKEKDSLIDGTDGMHICFGMVVAPYIIRIVLDEMETAVYKAFQFMEEMSFSSDTRIKEILDFTLLEQIIDEGESVLNNCKKFMLSNTVRHCEKIEEYFL